MKVRILNAALARLPQGYEVASEADNTPIARTAFRVFDSVYRDLSGRTDWSFLRKDVKLSNPIIVSDPSFYRYSFVVPPDFERVLLVTGDEVYDELSLVQDLSVGNRGSKIREYYYSDRKVFTNFNPAYMTYLIRQEDALQAATGSFITALEFGIAAGMALHGSGSLSVEATFTRKYERQILVASNVNLFEKRERDLSAGGIGGSGF